MAQPPGQFPVYHPAAMNHPLQHIPIPIPLPYLPIPASHTPRPMGIAATEYKHPTTTKRRRDEGGVMASGEESSAKRRAVGQDVIFRIIVPSRQIGKVIGKEGCRIQKIREETKATIKIADAIVRHEERVIIISCKDNDNMVVTEAEAALERIATSILKEDDNSSEALKAGPAHVAANTIRLLIAGCQAGGLIGMSGENIEKLRNSSGATIAVLAPNQLPSCASAHESDRVVQLSGDISAVLKALKDISQQLRSNPPRQVISISPTYNYNLVQPAQPCVDPNSGHASAYVTCEMQIPESLVGGLIGRSGSNISKIRNESGATIKVYGGKGEKTHRQIQFTGNSLQVALARQRVDEYIYSQMIEELQQQQPS